MEKDSLGGVIEMEEESKHEVEDMPITETFAVAEKKKREAKIKNSDLLRMFVESTRKLTELLAQHLELIENLDKRVKILEDKEDTDEDE